MQLVLPAVDGELPGEIDGQWPRGGRGGPQARQQCLRLCLVQ